MNEIVVIIIGMGLVTYIPRMMPLVIISKLELPEYIELWFEFIPVSILTILLTLNFISYNQSNFNINSNMIIASLPTILVATKTKSLIKTVIVGILAMAILNLV
ncbi:branched-chain amino acid transporter AzlD [archaeon SCG-AAA382B04]|nr:branched-chain amino acid transporter AzlD [archaeon SCG-AAA382B04]